MLKLKKKHAIVDGVMRNEMFPVLIDLMIISIR